MAAHTDPGTRTPSEGIAGRPVVQVSCPEQRAGGDASEERIDSPQKGRSLWEQFLHNLMLALGALPV